MFLVRSAVIIIIIGIAVYFAPAIFNNAPVDLPAFEMIEWDDKVNVATGDAYMGPWRMNASEFHLVDDPSVSLNSRGTAAVAWADYESQNIKLQLFESDGTTRFDEPVTVPSEPNIFSWFPRVLLSDDGNKVYLLWQEIVFSGGSHGGEIFFSFSEDGGQTFEGPVNLSNTEAGAGKGRFTAQRWFNGSYDLAKSGDGHIYAAWTEYEGAVWFSRSADGGRTFLSPYHIDGGNYNPARSPEIAVGADGEVYIAWSKGEGHDSDIFYTVSNDFGETFGEPKSIFESSGHSDSPSLAISENGDLHTVWSESEEGLWGAYRIKHSRLNRESGDFSVPEIISDTSSGQVASSAYPAMALSGEYIFVLWDLFPNLGQRPQGLGISVSENSGESFSPPGVVPGSVDPALGSNGSRQGLYMNKLDVNRDGAIAVVNSTFSEGESSHIWLFLGTLQE